MRLVLSSAFVLICAMSCSFSKKDKGLATLTLEQIGHFALNKSVKYVIDSLHCNPSELMFIEEPPRIIIGVGINFSDQGTVKFFFGRTSIISDTISTNEYYLNKVAQEIIDDVEWTYKDGRKGVCKKCNVLLNW